MKNDNNKKAQVLTNKETEKDSKKLNAVVKEQLSLKMCDYMLF